MMLLKPYYLATYVYISKYQDMLMNVAYIMASAYCFSIEDTAPQHSKCVQYARQNDLLSNAGLWCYVKYHHGKLLKNINFD